MSALVVSGLAETAAGALTGWPLALAVDSPDVLRRAGIRAPDRIRQLHLDLIIMGGLVTAAGVAVPGAPKRVTLPLAVGAWTNALSFLPLAVQPSVVRSPAYRAALVASFVATTTGFLGMAVVAAGRLRTPSGVRLGAWSA